MIKMILLVLMFLSGFQPNQIYSKFLNSDKNVSLQDEKKDYFLYVIDTLRDVPYKYGGTSLYGMDCSYFVKYVFKESLNIILPRTSSQQSVIGHEIKKDELKCGDLVFFNTRGKRISHVGIYIGNDEFVHASVKKGVTNSLLSDKYYTNKFILAKRIINLD